MAHCSKCGAENVESANFCRVCATKLGVDQSTVCLWETGKTQPRAKLLTKIAEIFGCTVDELLSHVAHTE